MENYKQKILVIIATANPGLQKLFLIAIAIALWGQDTAGRYAAEFSVIYFISLFSCIGFGARLLKIIPREQELNHRGHLVSMLWCSIIASFTTYIIAALTIFHVEPLELHFSFGTLSFIAANSLYQIYRHYFMAKKLYVDILKLDGGWFFFLAAPIFLIDFTLYFSVFPALFLALLLVLLIFFSKNQAVFINALKDREVFQFSLNNIVGGGVVILLPKILSLKLQEADVSVLAFYLGLLGFIGILPKSYINFKIPDFSLGMIKSRSFNKEVAKGRSENKLIIIGSLALGTCMYPVVNTLLSLEYIFNIPAIEFELYVSILLFLLSGALGIVDGAILFLKGKQARNIESNILYFSAFLSTSFMFISLDNFSLIQFLLALASFSAFRSLYLRYFVNNYFRC